MNSTLFHIAPYKLLCLGTLFTGLTLAWLLWFAKRGDKTANRLLSLSLGVTILNIAGLPLALLLALGPLLYFYVRRLTLPERRLQWKDGLHFCPLLAGYLLPQSLVLLPVTLYLLLSHRLIQRFYDRLQPVLMDRPRFAFRRLNVTLFLLGCSCLLILFNAVYCPAVGFILISMATAAIWKTDISMPLAMGNADERQRARRLKEAVAAGRLYTDANLTLTSLAVKLGIHPHDLSRIINNGLKQNFSDFINEFRVREVARKMQDPACDRLTLLGIAYESGFSSKTTFIRVFRETTGKSPAEYKNSLNKQVPINKLAPHASLRPVILRQESPVVWASETKTRNFMIRNYFKIAWRSLLKNKGFTLLNILGLTAGLATCLLIVLYVIDERSYDRYNTKADQVYRVNVDVKFNGNDNAYAAVPAPMAAALKSELPEVEAAMRFHQAIFTPAGKYYIKKGNVNLLENKTVFADAGLFDLFTLQVIDGNAATALTAPYSAVITESTARKYFKNTNAAGQTLVINDSTNYKVTAVIKDLPAQSHFNYDVFLSAATLPDSRQQSWMGGGWNTYVLARKGVTQQKLEADINSVAAKHLSGLPAGFSIKFDLIPLTDIHLRSDRQQELGPNGSIQYVYIFSVIALFILLIACVNFMNLSTARSSNRAKEVGVRKVLGSSRKNLVAQFLTESTLLSLFATLLAGVFAWLLLPLFNGMAGKQLAISLSSLLWLVPLLLAVALVIGFLAGSYPAFFLSAFEPVAVLKGKIAAGFKGGFLRSFLVVFQFAISVFLIISTLVMYRQLDYIHSKNLGFNRDQVLIIQHTELMGNKASLLKEDIKQLQGVVNTTMTSYLPTAAIRNTTALFAHLPIDLKEDILTEFWPVDEDYVATLGIKLVSGRNFSREMATDTSAIIVNEAYVKALGVKDPVGKTVYRDSYGVQPYHIIGVMKDFHFNSLRDKISPVVLYKAADAGAISVKLRTAKLPALLAQIGHQWKSFSPNQEFSYSFMDEDFDAAYRAEQRVGTLFIAFSTLAILVACLGLFGLAAFAAEQRNKEIGVRKVLGATVSGIVGMLSLDFIKLVLISILIASPLAWYAMSKWLQGFAYRVQIQWWIIAAAGLLALLIAFITISLQSVKAALANPVKSLRSE